MIIFGIRSRSKIRRKRTSVPHFKGSLIDCEMTTAIPRLLRTSLIALSLISHQQILTIPHFLRSLFSLIAHFALQNWCNLVKW